MSIKHHQENSLESSSKKRKYSSSLTDENLVNIELIDFNVNFPSHMLEKFKSKRKKAFSNEIDNVDNISGFKNPFDVKICHSLGCIIVSDHGNDRIQFFCLMSRNLMKSIIMPATPVYIDVVENDTGVVGGNSLIISCCDGHVYKYSLFEMLNHQQPNELKHVWKSQLFDGPAGLQHYGNAIYFCDPYLKFSILSLSDGKVLEQMDFGFCVWNVQVINEFTLLLTNQDEKYLSILKKINETEWKSVKEIHFNDFFYALFDTISYKIITVNTDCIKVMDMEGRLESVSDISNNSKNSELIQESYVGGCTLNSYNGELYFADYCNNVLRIFRY
ncbi:predicted protein [Naegleria gruberi]|uniref:Predicted protein n=1 Tax=Naegleria gruberi TaxID=5762 RepID=D2VS97_NAEGR|nr:uncharacterized protein NAEGRDRAFT_71863 [Naegleria gruberi]EFC40387.1 predicted protein [Naegleria gruberi]|eukprot:XP_002673131.1 predicted protein [Naegleria gruberi strain NEG-M]